VVDLVPVVRKVELHVLVDETDPAGLVVVRPAENW